MCVSFHQFFVAFAMLKFKFKFKFKIKKSTPLHKIYSQCTDDPYVSIRYYRVKSIDLVGRGEKKNVEKEQQSTTTKKST